MIKKNNILFLASSSAARQHLLRESKIPFELISQNADESQCDLGLPTLGDIVLSIARYKMEHVVLPSGSQGEIMFVLTADTLSQDSAGTIYGKPTSMEDAISMIKKTSADTHMKTATAFCLERKRFKKDAWVVEQRIEQVVNATYRFIVPAAWIDQYCAEIPVLEVAGAMAIEGFGGQFLQFVNGSYSAIVGLPLFEVRQALIELGFY